ncbi:armadillo repeat-containing protein 6 homolog [Ostrinia furnacalis]|uniref:armadillo repeat-containing protein 6 homolog n=1 Tax=Ostrinia furnacalis TaxID=93504 RepID=UPI00103AC621|nr:armadillo repeat-containing protein 6 homolog [Ostrinia furnacalis]
MVRVITQETYDEVVQENIDEFEMTPEEAIKEAVAQFEAQGVDLSNIIKDLALNSGDGQGVSSIVSKLKELCSRIESDDEAILKELEALKVECNKDIARRVKAGKDGAYNILTGLLESRFKSYVQKSNEKDDKIIISTLNSLIALMDVQPDLLDEKGADLIKSILDKIDDGPILISALKWTSVCCVKHEMNRQRLFAKNIGDNLKLLLNARKNIRVVSEAMSVIRKFTLDDDVRVEFGKAHEHAKELGAKLLDPLTQFLKEHPVPPVVSETMLTMAALLVRHELCAMAADAGADEALFAILAANFDCVLVIVQASKLITALAGNDEVKRQLMKAGIAPILVTLLNRHSSNPTAAALILKCISALTLREPSHSQQFFDSGAPEVMIEAIKNHPTDASVQKNGCWAIRNMVARCRDQNPKFHELGVESLLNEAYDRFSKDFGFDIKSALRDLECDVKLDEQWKGKGVQMENN